jgi:predicted transcriptional regulator of viral defense system
MATVRRSGLPTAVMRLPLRTFRARDLADVYANPRAELARLAARGLVHRLAWGYYVVVPQEHVGGQWIPTLELAAAGIGTADFGARQTVLMGVSAARIHGAIPRGLASAVVAVPSQRAPVNLVDRSARVQFVSRRTDRLDVEAVGTELGRTLATTPEQTVLDLARRPQLGGVPDEVIGAVRLLWPRCDESVVGQLARAQRLGVARRQALDWLR